MNVDDFGACGAWMMDAAVPCEIWRGFWMEVEWLGLFMVCLFAMLGVVSVGNVCNV